MRCAKRLFGLFLPVLALIAAGALISGTAQAAITFSGDVSPADSSLWNLTTNGYIGNTAAGNVTVDSGSSLASQTGYICNRSSSTGLVTVDGDGSTWENSAKLYVAWISNGALHVNNGGSVSVAGTTYVGANGTIGFGGTGGTLSTNGLWAPVSQLVGTGTIITKGLVSDINLTFDGTPTTDVAFGTAGAMTVDMSATSGNGDLGVGYASGGVATLKIQNMATVCSAGGYMGYDSTSSGTATVTGAGSKWTTSGSLYVGYFGDGTLKIASSGIVSSGGNCYIGKVSNSSGTAMVTGSDSLWDMGSNDLHVGDQGNGTLKITSGGSVSNNGGYISAEGGSISTATVDGTGSTWSNSGALSVGREGFGTLNIYNGGAVSNTAGYLGYDANSKGVATVDGSGSTWSNSGNLYVAKRSDGDLYITGGGSVTATGTTYVGTSAGYFGTIHFNAGTLTTKTLYASPSHNYSTLTGTGTINTNGLVSDVDLTFDSIASKSQTLTITGTNTSIAVNLDVSDSGNLSDLGAGYWGSGTLLIRNGVTVDSNLGYLAYQPSSSGMATIADADSTWNISSLYVGKEGTGTLKIQNGGAVSVTNTTYVGYGSASYGTIAFGGTGGTLSTKELYLNESQFTGTGTINARGFMGDANLTFDGSGQTTTTLGASVTLNLNMSDSTDVGALSAGYIGTGSLTIRNGATVYSTEGHVGYKGMSSGAATVAGSSTWTNAGWLYVGYSGAGTLEIQTGSTVKNTDGYIGYIGVSPFSGNPASMGAVTVAGANAVWTNTDSLFVGHSGTGTLAITNGGAVSNANGYIGYAAGMSFLGIPCGEGEVTVSGGSSTWTNTESLYVGYNGTGSLTIRDNGTVVASSVTVADGSSAVGTVNFDGGVLKANAANSAWITAGSGTCNVYVQDGGAIFDTQAYSMGIALPLQHGTATTDGGVTKLGGGMLTLSDANTYNGATTVKDGTLTLVGTSTATPIAWNPVLNLGGADIQAGKLVFDYTGGTSPADAIRTILHDSFGTSNPFSQGNGEQIYSTTAGTANRALGWIDDVENEEVVVMYTLYGDSNLDGSVNGSDLNAVLSSYNLSGQVWAGGDFNYDGSVNGSDLNTVLSNYNQSLSASTAAVPEPSTLLLMLAGLACLLAYVRSKRK